MTARHEREIEVRCPLHGFIRVRDWEREIVNHPAFLRLRRIRQLAWTEQVYPGAVHNRFEHSLGVMHVADEMFSCLSKNSRDFLTNELNFTPAALERDRMLVRLTALLHDLGHSPFSHASEDLFPSLNGEQLEHEDYSAAIIRRSLADVINSHPDSTNFGITAEDVASMLDGKSTDIKRSLIWRDLITGQLDADRIDYLLRDSLHAGVDYGNFDWKRLIRCLVFARTGEETGARIGLQRGGLHAAEGLVLARYFMFVQVYFHKTRVAYDRHLKEALIAILPGGKFPTLVGDGLEEYLKWDDWRVCGKLSDGGGGEHGERLRNRNHYRMIFETPEIPNDSDKKRFELVREKLGNLVSHDARAGKAWYKLSEDQDIPVVSENPVGQVLPLSEHSAAVKGLKQTNRMMLYCTAENKEEAKRVIQNMEKSE